MKKYIVFLLSILFVFSSFLSASQEFIYQSYPAWIDFKGLLTAKAESYTAPLMAEGKEYRVVYTCSPALQRVVEIVLYEKTLRLATAKVDWKVNSRGEVRLKEVAVTDSTGRAIFRHAVKEAADGRFSATVVDVRGDTRRYFYDAKMRLVRQIEQYANGRMLLRTWDYADTKELQKEWVQLFESGDLLYEEETLHAPLGVTRKELKAYTNGNLTSRDTFEWKITGGALREFHKIGKDKRKLSTRFEARSDGKIAKKIKPDGIEINYEYDDKAVLQRISSSDKTVDYQIRYDERGNISEIIDHVTGCTHIRVFAKDGRHGPEGRLVSEEINGKKIMFLVEGDMRRTLLPDQSSVFYLPDYVQRVDGNGQELYRESRDARMVPKEKPLAESLQFDALQHLIEKDDSKVLQDEFGNPVQFRQGTVQYDVNGRVIAKEMNGVKFAFAYDALDRLIEVYRDNRLVQTLSYDLFNRCIGSKTETGSFSYWYYLDEEIAATNENGEVVQLKVSAPTFSPRLIELDKKPYRVVSDSKGSILQLLDFETNELLEEYSYSPTGKELIRTVAAKDSKPATSPWRFLGRRTFDETHLVAFTFRLYDPSIVRWMTEDPLRFLDGPNATRFASNDPLGLFELSVDFSKIYEDTASAFSRVCQKAIHTVTFAQHQLEWFFEARTQFEDVAFQLMSKTFWTLLGYNPDSNIVGVTGGKEVSEKVRVTLINGILNAHSHVVNAAELVSELHGNTAIHYLYASSGGFTADILRGIFTKTGFYTPQAALLVTTWRGLIQEMGGVNSQGTIVHYAHSLGGADTARALQELTPSERKMIRVVTFGSAALIDRECAGRVHNYVSHKDLVPLADPVNYVEGWRGKKPEIVFLPSDIPFDHSMVGLTYKKTLEELGLQFQKDFLGPKGNNQKPVRLIAKAPPVEATQLTPNALPVSPPPPPPPTPMAPPKPWRIRAVIREKNYYKMGRFFARSIQTKEAFEEVEKVGKTMRVAPLHRALTSCRAIMQLNQELGLTSGELLQLCLYIETRMKTKIRQQRYIIDYKKNRLARDIEYHAPTRSIFIHLGTKGVQKVGSGCHKSVTKSILYDIHKPEVVANCRAPLADIEEMKAVELLQGERGIVEGKAFIVRKDKLAMILKLYNANTVDYISKNKSQTFTVQEKIQIATDLLYGLSAMHRRNLLHRDLHMGNAIIDVGPNRKVTAAIIDFGKTIPKEKSYGEVAQGYPPCTAPEAFYLHKLQPDDYFATDIYSLGCTLYTLHYGKRPPWFGQGYFRHLKLCNQKTRLDHANLIKLNHETVGAKRNELRVKIAKKESTLEEEFECLILQMMNTEPSRRGTAEELRDKMESLQRKK